MASLLALVLAAGKGTRMLSESPKVLQPLGGRPMIFHLIDTLLLFPDVRPALVYGFGGEQLQAAVNAQFADVQWVEQKEQLGTGHAVRQAMDLIAENDVVLIVYGDTPLVRFDTLQRLCERAKRSGFALLTAICDQPQGYGRILRNEDDALIGIVEEKDADVCQRLITEINTGMMAVKSEYLLQYLPLLDNHNSQQEFYLTDLVGLMARDGIALETVLIEDFAETQGINNRMQLAEAESVLRYRRAQELLEQGVTLIDPARIDIQGEVRVGRDVVIEPNVMLAGDVVIGDNVYIEAGARIENSVIGDGCRIRAYSVLEGARLQADVQAGPFARLRPKAHLQRGARVGNFVEIKAAEIGEGSKINHLSYIGDARVGGKVNIGAGTITCNYDGANKWQTLIGDGVFVGSNTALVAPVAIGKEAVIGAGSVITQAVSDNQLAIARARQVNKDGWQKPSKREKK